MASLWSDFLDVPDYLEGSPWFPNPLICVRDMAITGTRETIHRLPWNGIGEWLNGIWYWMSRAHYDDPSAIILPVLLAVLLTLLRLFLTWKVFNVSGGVWRFIMATACFLAAHCQVVQVNP